MSWMFRLFLAVTSLLVGRLSAVPLCPEAASAQCDVAREVTLLQAKLDLKTVAKQPVEGTLRGPEPLSPKHAHLPAFPRALVPNVSLDSASDGAAFLARTTDSEPQRLQIVGRSYRITNDSFSGEGAVQRICNTGLVDCEGIQDILMGADIGNLPTVEPTADNSTNLCHEGLLGAELWILGAAKTGTSSMASDLGIAGIRSDMYPFKESHVYDRELLQIHPDFEKDAEIFSQQLQAISFPCPANRTVIGEFTPDNLRNPWLPETLQHMYPASYLRRIKFIILAREPLDRLASGFFFHYESANNQDFRNYFTEVLQDGWKWNGAGNPNLMINFRLWASMYGGQLRKWLVVGAPDQFYIIPKEYYFNGYKATMFRELGEWMEIRLQGEETEASHSNSNTHEGPRDLLPAEQIQSFNKLIEPDIELFVDLMATGSTQGMRLGNYTGQVGDKGAIDSWLKAGW